MNQQKALETLATVYDMVAADVYDMVTKATARCPILDEIEAEIKRLQSIAPDPPKCQPFQKELRLAAPHKESSGEPQSFESLPAGKYRVSVQGSAYAQCTPRKDLSPDDYTAMEMTIISGSSWLNRRNIPEEIDFLREYWTDSEFKIIGGYVPVELIQKAIDILREERD